MPKGIDVLSPTSYSRRMSTEPVGPDYHNALDNLLTLWGYERSLRTGNMLRVNKPGVDGSGFTGFTHWSLKTWIDNLKTFDEYLAGRVNIRRPPVYTPHYPHDRKWLE